MKTMIAVGFDQLAGPLFTPLPGNRFVLHQIRGYETRVFDDGSREVFAVASRLVGWKLGGAGSGKPGGGEPIPVSNDVQARAA